MSSNISNVHSYEHYRDKILSKQLNKHYEKERNPKLKEALSTKPRVENMNILQELIQDMMNERQEIEHTKLEGAYGGKENKENKILEVLI